MFLCEKQLGGGIPEVFKQGDDYSRRLIRIGGRKDAFLNSLMDDLLQPGREAFDSGDVEFVADDSILIAILDTQGCEHEALVRVFPLVKRRKEALEFVEGAEFGIPDDGGNALLDVLPHAFDQC